MPLLHGDALASRWSELLDWSTMVDIAVAWITDCEAVSSLRQVAKGEERRLRVVVGVHDYLTSAAVLRELHDHRAVKIGFAVPPFKFHPKLYMFANGDETICWVGSANLTGAGLGGNIELVHEFDDAGGEVRTHFEDLWDRFNRPNAEWLRTYEETAEAHSTRKAQLTQMAPPEALLVDDATPTLHEPCYRTVPRARYSQPLMRTANNLMQRISARMERGRALWRQGSASVELRGSREVVAKVLVYEAGLCRPTEDALELLDGVYVLVRTDCVSSEAIWNTLSVRLQSIGLQRAVTIGLQPNCSKRFAYTRLTSTANLDNVAMLIADCANLGGV
jgi:HKD family nuclease